jgi:hypothetical protein
MGARRVRAGEALIEVGHHVRFVFEAYLTVAFHSIDMILSSSYYPQLLFYH